MKSHGHRHLCATHKHIYHVCGSENVCLNNKTAQADCHIHILRCPYCLQHQSQIWGVYRIWNLEAIQKLTRHSEISVTIYDIHMYIRICSGTVAEDNRRRKAFSLHLVTGYSYSQWELSIIHMASICFYRLPTDGAIARVVSAAAARYRCHSPTLATIFILCAVTFIIIHRPIVAIYHICVVSTDCTPA